MMPLNIVDTPEEYERFLRDVLIPRYEALKADPSLAVTHEQMVAALAEWDREDSLLLEEKAGPMQRRA